MPRVEGKALHSAHCQQEVILQHATEVHQTEADGCLVVIQLNDAARLMRIQNSLKHYVAAMNPVMLMCQLS